MLLINKSKILKGEVGMKAICPNNENHKEFHTVAHVVQTWRVDEAGNFIDEISTDEVVASPDTGNRWHCAECGALVEEFE